MALPYQKEGPVTALVFIRTVSFAGQCFGSDDDSGG